MRPYSKLLTFLGFFILTPLASGSPLHSGVEASLLIGGGLFQDIQVPMNYLEDRRADNTTTEKDTSEHQGIPISMSMGYFNKAPFINYQISAEYITMSDTMPATGSVGAGYKRYELKATAMHTFANIKLTPSIGTAVSWRRSIYSNISNGHSVNSNLAYIIFGLGRDDGYKATFSLAKSLGSSLNYGSGSSFKYNEISHSSAQLTNLNFSLNKSVAPQVWLTASLYSETAQLSIPESQSYKELGLAAYDFGLGTKNFMMKTQTLSLGFKKKF